MWDHDKKGNELIAYFFEKYNEIDRYANKQSGVKWVNLYGSPEYKDSSTAMEKIKKFANTAGSLAGQVFAGDIDPKEFYNHTPEKASMYKGRVLINVKIADKRPAKYDEKFKDQVKSFRRFKKPPPANLEPSTKNYLLKALVVSGSEMPEIISLTLGKKRLQIRISMGTFDMMTDSQDIKDGVVKWNQPLEYPDALLPDAPSMLPDIFIYLMLEGNSAPICFYRVDPKELLKQKFTSPAKWYIFKEDKVINY